MKKLFFFFAMLAGVAASAQTLNIQITKIDYSTKIATCDLSWTARNATHLSDVWIFVDYIEISGNTTIGGWETAAITGATVTTKTTGNATASIVSGNTRGVWIKSTASGANFTGQIILQLSTVPAKFNACAYASDYPPNAAAVSSGTYTLKGTTPFKINTTTINDTKYTGALQNSLTDATGCPGCLDIQDHAVVAGIPCCPRLTAVGGYCRNLVADDASTYTGLGIEIKKETIGSHANCDGKTGCPAGWRYPTLPEVQAMNTYRSNIWGSSVPVGTWVADGCSSNNTSCGQCNGATMKLYHFGDYSETTCGVFTGKWNWWSIYNCNFGYYQPLLCVR
jgi:hypothetical protein